MYSQQVFVYCCRDLLKSLVLLWTMFFLKSKFQFQIDQVFVALLLDTINVKFQEHLLTKPLAPLPPYLPPCNPPYPSSLHKSSGCILKGAKIFTLSKVVKGFCVHTGADKEEAPSAWLKENCWNKSAHTKTQGDNGAGAGPDPETETHNTPQHTVMSTQSARLGTKSAHWLIFVFLEHTVFRTYSIRRWGKNNNNIT